MNSRPCACAVGSSRITPTHWLRVSSRNFGSTMSSARSISLAASNARSTSPSTSNARQSRCSEMRRDIELTLERRELLDGAARQRFEAAFAQVRKAPLQAHAAAADIVR